MAESPIDQLLGAIDTLDLGAVMGMLAPECELLTADGHRAEGGEAVRELVGDFLSMLRSTSHRVAAQWHQDDVWFAEVEADYELRDGLNISGLPRAFVLHDGPKGLVELHVYGAHERPLTELERRESGIRIGGRWIPSL